MSDTWTEGEAQKWIDENYPGAQFIRFIRYKEGDQKRTDVVVTCVECKNEFTRDWYNYRHKGNGTCTKCSRKHGGDWHKLSDEFLKYFVENNSKCKFIASIRKKKGNKGAVLYLKLQCGEENCTNVFETTWNSFNKETACRMCPSCTDKIRRYTRTAHAAVQNNLLEKCPDIAKVWNYNKNKYGPEHYSAGSDAKVWFICDKENCKHEWKTNISSVVKSILNGNNGCKECMKKYKEFDEETFIQELHKLHPYIHLDGPYNGINKPSPFYCDICDNKWTVRAGNLIGYGKAPTGCAVCSGKRIGPPPKYINSIWADPIFSKIWAKYFDEEFMKTHTVQSSEYVDIPCPDCGKNKHTKVSNLYHRGFRCDCNSRGSYPNKFMYSIFNQLGVDFIPEYHDDWTCGKQYDIYNEQLSLIVENHGIQHYEEAKFTNRSLEEEQANDAYKYQLAIDNGIQNYIVIDCRYSEIEWIKRSVINSDLSKLLNFTEDDIDWNKAEQDAVKNLVREVCEEWEKEKSYDYSIIGDKFHISKSTVQDYLLIGSKHGWCSYNPNWQLRKVYCFQLDKEFASVSIASKETGINDSDIIACCRRNTGCAGLHPETGEELVWCYAEEKDTYVPRENKARKPVVCIETMVRYKSSNEAHNKTGISAKGISVACSDYKSTAGGFHWSRENELTEEKIEWAKTHSAPIRNHFIYCVNNDTIYKSADDVRFNVGDWQVVQYINGIRGRAGKSGYDYKFVHDFTNKDGTIIPGAITLGLLTQERFDKFLRSLPT